MRKFLKYSLGLGLAAFGYDEYNESKIIRRNANTIRCGLNILYQYKIRFNAENANDVHETVAKDIYETCIRNDGLYVKFGQGIAASEHLLPPPYFKWMSLLQDKAKAVSFKRVRDIFEEEIGKKIEEIFDEFDEIPIASASIAQVHKAKLKNGDIVAVKVQKPNIKKQFGSDMLMHHIICGVLQYAFDMPILQFQESIQSNLQKEIDFRIEYENGEISRRALQIIGRKDVHIPKYYEELNTQRILVSEWIDGIKISHQDEIRKLGFNTKQIMDTVISAFAEQIFISGFVHCDPHPGNIFIRPKPGNNKQYEVVLLDFGLCIKLENQFRLDYSEFWTSIFLQDFTKLKQIVRKWGIGNEEMFASMQLMKPYQMKQPVHCHQVTKEDVMKLQLKMKDEIREMMKQTDLFPKDLIFVNRNMNLVRSVNKRCGSLVNRINIMARYAQQGTQQFNDILESQKFNRKYHSSLMFELRLWVSGLVYSLLSIWLKWKKNQKVEDFLEQKQKEQFQGIHEQYGFKTPDEKTFDA
ncbi:unnamed protein product [Paramecium pentaurelia]|uniref:Protein kinase domain-containing protein n=1 Tax=Paramecium pentaurelia TaxID=43138 RepID=A0A8S1UKY7_9CILI|nr:unnamed protein product [Paramecium pentaurelia]